MIFLYNPITLNLISCNFSDRNYYRGKNFKEKKIGRNMLTMIRIKEKNDELSVVYKRETISLVTKNHLHPSRNGECCVTCDGDAFEKR